MGARLPMGHRGPRSQGDTEGVMTPTPSQTVGPFFGFALPFEQDAHAVPAGANGAIRIEGQLLDGAGEPVPDGLLEVSRGDQFARCRTDVEGDRKSTRLNSSHSQISYAVFCLKKKK